MSDNVAATPGQMTPSDHLAQTGAPPAQRASNPAIGYYFAVLNAIVSGFAIYINSIGVKLFADSTLYTTLKNSVVGVALLIPFIFLATPRQELRRLNRRQWLLLLLITLIGGSFAYALDFRGLQISTAPTSAIVDHTQFLFVAIFAALTIGERFSRVIWVALGVLFIGLSLGITFKTVRLDSGVLYLLAGTICGAAAAILIKVALRTVSVLTVMLFKMTLGAVVLLVWMAVAGRLGAVAHLSTRQWEFVIVTGLILLAFTVTMIVGLRHASATGVVAISAGSPIITTLLVVLTRNTRISTTTWLGLGLVLVAVLMIYAFGRRQEMRAAQQSQPAPTLRKAALT